MVLRVLGAARGKWGKGFGFEVKGFWIYRSCRSFGPDKGFFALGGKWPQDSWRLEVLPKRLTKRSVPVDAFWVPYGPLGSALYAPWLLFASSSAHLAFACSEEGREDRVKQT